MENKRTKETVGVLNLPSEVLSRLFECIGDCHHFVVAMKDHKEVIDETVAILGIRYLQYASYEMRGNKKFVLKLIRECQDELRQARDEARSYSCDTRWALAKYGPVFQYASHALKSDRELKLEALKSVELVLECYIGKVKSNRDSFLEAVKRIRRVLENARD